MENYWSPLILDSVKNTIDIAKKVTWKGMNPIVMLMDKVYETGVKVSKDEMTEIEKFIQRNPKLNKWDLRINYSLDG